MNPEKFPIKKHPIEIKKSSQTEHHYTDREKEQGLTDYEEYVSNELNEAMAINEELKEYRERRREKDETFDFQKWGELEFALKQRERNINAKADEMDKKFDIQVERPDFNEILENSQNTNQEQQAT